MNITIDAEREAQLTARADAEGISVSEYISRLIDADRLAEKELVTLAVEGLHSGQPIVPGSDYWEEKHRRLDERLAQFGPR